MINSHGTNKPKYIKINFDTQNIIPDTISLQRKLTMLKRIKNLII